MTQLALALTIISGTVLVIGVFSQALKRTPLQESLIAVAVGVIAGPHGLGWLDIATWTQPQMLIENVALVTLAIGLMAVALRISAQDLRRYLKPTAWLLTLGMVGMWLSASLSAAWLLDMPLWSAAMLGAVVTPTDPVVASSIVTGNFAREHLPRRIRSLLSLESGANDGLAYLLVMLPILVLTGAESLGLELAETVFRGILLGAAIGVVLGYAAARVLHWALKDGLIESYSSLTFTATLSLFTLGVATLAGTAALISVFIAGLTFNLFIDTGERHEEERIQESMSKLFTLPTFVLFGLTLPVGEWAALGPPLAIYAVAILLLRRLPVIALLYPLLRGTYRTHDAAFVGWFGPLGVAAVYYATFAVKETGQSAVWTAASAVVAASILVHGLSAAPLTRRYARAEQR